MVGGTAVAWSPQLFTNGAQASVAVNLATSVTLAPGDTLAIGVLHVTAFGKVVEVFSSTALATYLTIDRLA